LLKLRFNQKHSTAIGNLSTVLGYASRKKEHHRRGHQA
jgi:hypothetical protein